jgi:polar amino acid transport system substrate-binding protein
MHDFKQSHQDGRSMKQWIFLIILILTAESAVAEELRIATHEWPPFISEKFPDKGAHVALVRAALEARGYGPIQFDIMPFARSMKETARLHYDLMMPVYLTRNRAEKFLFSDSYQSVETVFMMRRSEDFNWKKLLDFTGLNMGVVQGYSYGEEFDNALFLRKMTVGSNSQLIRMLEDHRIDAFLIDLPVARYILSRELAFLTPRVEVLNPPYRRNECRVVASRLHPKAQALIDDFNAGLQIIKRDGTWARIMGQYRQSAISHDEERTRIELNLSAESR